MPTRQVKINNGTNKQSWWDKEFHQIKQQLKRAKKKQQKM